MKQRRSANQIQALLFDELRANETPSWVEIPPDRSRELETAVAELLLKAAGEAAQGRGGHGDA